MTWSVLMFAFPLSLLALGWAAMLLQERSNRRATRVQYTLPGIKKPRHDRAAGKGLGLLAGLMATLAWLLDALGVHNNRA